MRSNLPDLPPRHDEDALRALLGRRIVILDGAMGTSIQHLDPPPEAFGGSDFAGCNENLVRSAPEVIAAVHRAYLEAGADIVETDTFGGTPLVLAEYGLADAALELNHAAAVLARRVCDEFETPGAPRFVAGSIGPTTRSLSITGGITFDELREAFHVQALGLLMGGVDVLLVETCQDSLNTKAALVALEDAFERLRRRVPVMVSATIEQNGTMLGGQDIESFATALEHAGVLSLGLNCATGPGLMADHLRSLSRLTTAHVSCVPNAGLPDEDGIYGETPDLLARALGRFADAGWLNLAGGCCGTTPDHIRAVAAALRGRPPRRLLDAVAPAISGTERVALEPDSRPLLVGERTNVIGSRAFRQRVSEGRFDEAAEVGRKQVRAGAQVVDVCLADPDGDELAATKALLPLLVRKVRAPIMIDSTDPEVIEAALRLTPGKSVINSVNLEDGGARLAQVCLLARRYGAALVVGCIDEDPDEGMARTADRKLAVARRAHALMTEQHGIPERDLWFDPLVFPCGTGDATYAGAAGETVDGVRAIKEALPGCHTLLGISNVSFGLPPAGREVLNAVFLYHCTRAGLDAAIVNAQRLERYASIPEEERRLAEDLLYARGDDALGAFVARFKGRSTRAKRTDEAAALLPAGARLTHCVVEGSLEGLIPALDELLSTRPALAIINGPLMDGMAEVGRLFADNELIVAEVLQSAEAMKAAVDHLEPHLSRADAAGRAKVLLATVKGDVHDIGKNLVGIILANNGYDVIDLGIKVTPEELIRAQRQHGADLIGLSGLLVRSAHQMVATARDLRDAGIDAPLLVGGAALSHRFTATRIAAEYGGRTFYCRDAMAGLDTCNRLVESGYELQPPPPPEPRGAPVGRAAPAAGRAASALTYDHDLPAPPDLDRHVVADVKLADLQHWINPTALYNRHLGLKGRFARLDADGDPKLARLQAAVGEALALATAEGIARPRALWRFFRAASEGDDLVLLDDSGRIGLERFPLPRQGTGDRLCAADFVLPAARGGADHVALFVTTCGDGVRARAEALIAEGRYLLGHTLQALALEGAEAMAEWLHADLRRRWGFPDPPEMSMQDRFVARYRGIRLSPGYPACPDLADQRRIFSLLRPEDIGVTLTDGDMMDPEASVSALVFHHPAGRYFSTGGA